MVGVGLVGVVLGSFRTHFSLDSFASGVLAIAAVRASRKLEAAAGAGQPAEAGEPVALFVRSVGVAFLILGGALIPLLAFIAWCWVGGRYFGRTLRTPSGDPVLVLFLIFIPTGWPISNWLRRRIW